MAEKQTMRYGDSVAAEALRIINGVRQEEYGDPEKNFLAVAHMWNSYLASIDRYILPADVANMMMLFKLARIMTGDGSRDTDVDLVGYALLGADIRQAMAERKARKERGETEVQQ